ncbi:hypothetical protein PUN28_008019 [Cardiocondyla obscurior]|uniref:CHK kinase-like domain-containing protein n=1 Tax=Cardiocondyla obscurior TaxID=286306 RepID=A0AAW2FXR3_9HYME
MSQVEQFQKWIKDVMSKVIKNLGSNVDEARYDVLSDHIDYYTCDQCSVNIKFKNKNGHDEEQSIILKRPTHWEKLREINRIGYQFHNEILFYKMYAQPGENFARLFYADEQPPTDTVIALENLCQLGYRPCSYTHDVPLEYTLAAFREMGRFHAKGYVMKERQREKFFDIVKQIREVRYDTAFQFKVFVDITATRTVDYLRGHGYDAAFCDELEALLSNAFDKVMMKTVEPREPLSTLCHGDFTASNVLFKTDSDGQYRAILVDFALITHSTPVVDLSTYLCLCCSNKVREDHFFDIMQAYHGSLKECLLEAGIWDAEKYSYEALLEDFRRGALFGFVIASFWLAPLKGFYNGDIRETGAMDYFQRGEIIKPLGGDEMSKILADMLFHLRDLGCLKYYF